MIAFYFWLAQPKMLFCSLPCGTKDIFLASTCHKILSTIPTSSRFFLSLHSKTSYNSSAICIISASYSICAIQFSIFYQTFVHLLFIYFLIFAFSFGPFSSIFWPFFSFKTFCRYHFSNLTPLILQIFF